MTIDESEITGRKKQGMNVAWFLLQGLSEVLATGLLLFVGCSGLVPGLTSSPPTHLQICIVFGIAVAVLVQVFGHISGSHINPTVTLAALIYNEISIQTAGLYILSQFLGGILGYGSLLLITPMEALYSKWSNMNVTHGFCTTVPNPQISTIQAILIEFAASAVLVYVCLSFWDKRNATQHDSAPFKFGLAVTGLATAFGPFTGGSMNPARSFAPAVFTGVWEKQWVYWVGPLSAAILVTYFYKFTFDKVYGRAKHDQSEDQPLNHLNSKVQNLEKVSTEEIS